MMISRYAALVVLCAMIGSAVPGLAAEPRSSVLTLGDAIGRLAQERTYAETGAGLLKKYAAQDQAALIRGQKLYAEAKAASDGLIEELLLDLAESKDPGESPKLTATLDAAAEKRLTFSRYVDAAVPELQDGTKNVIVDALAKSVGEIVKDLLDSGIAIWNEYQRRDAERRRAVATRVEAQRWRAFADVEPAA